MKSHRCERIPGIVPSRSRVELILSGERLPMRQPDVKESVPYQRESPVLTVTGSREPDRIALDRREADGLKAGRVFFA